VLLVEGKLMILEVSRRLRKKLDTREERPGAERRCLKGELITAKRKEHQENHFCSIP
jgi:hypothetical protein